MRLIVLASFTLSLSAQVAAPPAIKAEGVPVIPRELAADLAMYGESRTAVFQSWHPDSREMLITTRFADTPQLHRVSAPGGARTQLTFGPERAAAGEFDPSSGRYFLYSRDVGGNENYQMFLVDTQTGRSVMITDGKSRNVGFDWSHNGQQVAFNSNRRSGRHTDIWIVDPRNPSKARMVYEAPAAGWMVSMWSPDDSKLLVTNRASAETSSLHQLDVATGRLMAITPEKPGVSYTAGRYSPDGRLLYATTTDGSDFERLVRIDVASGKIVDIGPKLNWDADSVDLTDDGKLLAFVINEEGTHRIRILDVATGTERPGPTLPAGVTSGVEWRKRTHELGFSFASAKSPSDVYSYDADTRKLERWTRSETGGLNADEFVEPELIRWKSFDGLTISGFLYRPPARFTGPRPVIINIHGGPEGQYQPGYLGRNNYYMNELGVAMLFPNVRGSTGYGKRFLSLDNGYKREDSVKDIGALLDWIGTQPGLDKNRVMAMGGSYGGYMTLASMTHFNDRLRCGLDVVGIANWVTFLQNTEAYRRDLRRVEYGDERDPKMKDFLLTISPERNVSKIRKPMMIVQGRNDPRVPWTESEQMVAAIRTNGTPVWYILAADEGHGFGRKINQDYQAAATVLFVRHHLLN